MAQPVQVKCGGCLIKLLITIVVIVALIGIAVAVVVNMTPNKLGFGDLKIGETTLDEMGLGDVKIKEMFKLIKTLAKPDEKAILDKPFHAAVDQPKLEGNLAESNIGTLGNGEPDYGILLNRQVTYPKQYMYRYDDTTLAYLFNAMVMQQRKTGDSGNEGVEFLKSLNANVTQISMNVTNGQATLKIVVSIDISSMASEIESGLGFASRFVKIPKTVYLVSELGLTADVQGILSTTSKSLTVNGTENEVADVILNTLMKNAGSDFEIEEDCKAQINRYVGQSFTTVVGNLGKVGKALVSVGTEVEADDPVEYGAIGLENGGLYVITHAGEAA